MSSDINTRYYKNTAVKREQANNPLNGIYVGKIVKALSGDRSFRYSITIPSLNKAGGKNEVYECVWGSPFAGGTNPTKTGKDVENADQAIKSYGFWAIPPDEGNSVLVAFADGSGKRGYIISCLFPDKLNHMMPGMPAGKSYSDPSMLMPVIEKNKVDEKITHNDAIRPLALDLAEGVVKQGLINDPLRGVGTSGARRANINEVYGMLTPGPKDPENADTRLGGHQFVMDDNLDSRMIRLRTASGAQLILDDTEGFVYIINKKGNAWFELNQNGDVYIHSEGTIAMRAKGNFDLRADKNINIEAGQNIHMKAAGDNLAGKYVGIPALGALGIPPLGTGGNIRFEAAADLTQYAGLNAQLTANGGDLDFNAGGRVATTASSPLGINLQAPMGTIKLESVRPTSILSSQFNVTAPAGTAITSAKILLNSGGAPALPALPANPAPQIGTNKKPDSAAKAPKWDREAGKAGKTSAPTAGKRTGKVDQIQTIVSKLITLEPFAGHGSYDPIKESAKPPAKDPSLAGKLPLAATDFSGVPASVSTPAGYMSGQGYTDQNGNPISSVTGAVNGVGETISSTVDSIADGITGQAGDLAAGLGAQDLLDGVPQFDQIPGISSEFTALMDMDFASITGLSGLLAGIQAAIPPIRFPTSNALAQKIIGIQKQLTELEAQLNQFALDSLNLPAGLDTAAITDMKDKIKNATAIAGAGGDFVSNLADQGIKAITDGPGTIFQDAAGNKLVDFTNGIGPVGATLGLAGDLTSSFDSVKGAISAPLTGNETLAVSAFTNMVGPETALKSEVITGLNKLGEIDSATNPVGYAVAKANTLREMTYYTSAPPAPGAQPQSSPPLQDFMYFATKLFQVPDGVDLPFSVDTYLPGTENFRTLGDELDIIIKGL